MSLFVVLATGQSLSQELVERVRHVRAVAVSDAYLMAPWADALVSNDANWWRHHPDALGFSGRRFCGMRYAGTEKLAATPQFRSGTNSGLQGMRVAEMLGATKIALLGFDMHGTHFFGPHHGTMKNSQPRDFANQMRQFDSWRGCEVVNCTQGSALKRFRFGVLDAEIPAARLVA